MERASTVMRHVLDSLHRRLRARAAMAGMSLSDDLRLELARSAEQLTPEELRARLAAMSRATVKERPADALRAERDRPYWSSMRRWFST